MWLNIKLLWYSSENTAPLVNYEANRLTISEQVHIKINAIDSKWFASLNIE